MHKEGLFKIIRLLSEMPFLEMVLIVAVIIMGIAISVMILTHYIRRSNLDSVKQFGYIGNDLIAGLFGLLIAFLIVSMYESNKNANESVYKEANILVSILLASQSLNNYESIHKEIQNYTKLLLEKQWPAMVDGDLTVAWQLEPEMINPLYREIQKSKPITSDQSAFQDSLPGLLEDLVSVHRLRLLQSDFHLPTQFWVIILLMIFCTICFLAYMNPWEGVHSLIPILFPSLIIALSVSLLISLHFPFLGPFAVMDTPFRSGYLKVL